VDERGKSEVKKKYTDRALETVIAIGLLKSYETVTELQENLK
jgi:hypothetical protein